MSLNHFSSSELQENLWWHQHQQLSLMEPTQNVNDSSPKRHRSQNPQHQHQHQHQHQQYASNWPPHYFYFNSFNSQESPPPPLPLFHPPTHPNLNFNLNPQNEAADDESSPRQPQENDPHNPQQQLQQMEESYKEPMFEKPLTPSDVGKLNRLVIPKQYAEKYFPLGGTDSSGEKGLLLSFEDESGKFWRFRYSYWNSSQSYVLTKGWSRYVKEKRLDAGDVILFERHRAEADRLFIGWRRRGGSTASQEGGNGGGGWNRGLMNSGTGQLSYPKDVTGTGVTTVPYQPDCLHAGSGVAAQNQTGNNSKTLRLFGVNMECQMEESEPSTPDGSSSSASSYGQAAAAAHHHPQAQQYFYHHPQPQAYSSSSNRHNHMDITFSQDVNQMMRNHQR